jgi:hypothetical protein
VIGGSYRAVKLRLARRGREITPIQRRISDFGVDSIKKAFILGNFKLSVGVVLYFILMRKLSTIPTYPYFILAEI